MWRLITPLTYSQTVFWLFIVYIFELFLYTTIDRRRSILNSSIQDEITSYLILYTRLKRPQFLSRKWSASAHKVLARFHLGWFNMMMVTAVRAWKLEAERRHSLFSAWYGSMDDFNGWLPVGIPKFHSEEIWILPRSDVTLSHAHAFMAICSIIELKIACHCLWSALFWAGSSLYSLGSLWRLPAK